jgi:hypothetical protein
LVGAERVVYFYSTDAKHKEPSGNEEHKQRSRSESGTTRFTIQRSM